jgi:RecA-family ATPase
MEQIILSWLSSHVTTVATWIISIGAVSLAIKKYGPKIRKFIKIGREAMDIIDTLLDAVQDDEIIDDEIKSIIKEVNDFKEAVK